MSLSIYYTARRQYPLTDKEKEIISSLLKQYSAEKAASKYNRWYRKWRWESFYLYDKFDESDVIIQGSTKLPDSSEKALWAGVQYWCELITEIRRSIDDAEWDVHVDDHEIKWLSFDQKYSPSI